MQREERSISTGLFVPAPRIRGKSSVIEQVRLTKPTSGKECGTVHRLCELLISTSVFSDCW